MKNYYKEILFAFVLVIATLIIWYAIDVFFLAFAAILLAILLNAIGRIVQKWIRLPYILSLFVGLGCIATLFFLVFWFYSSLIVEQFQLLLKEVPAAAAHTAESFAPLLPKETFAKEFSWTNQRFFSQVLTLFSSTVGSIVSFIIFVIVGFYLAVIPQPYLRGALYTFPDATQKRIWAVLEKIGQSLRFWLLGKVLSMLVIGCLTSVGLWLLSVPLALVLGLLAGVLTFIPYVGPILASLPAILIAFAADPIYAVYVIILYLGIHAAEGYLITPIIEQNTVSIPPALTIMGQILLFVLIGGLGLALASPFIVVIMALIVSLKNSQATRKASQPLK